MAVGQAEKALAKHDKEFRKGMEIFEQGCECPTLDSPLKFGWLAAKEMREVRIKYLEQSRTQAGVNI